MEEHKISNYIENLHFRKKVFGGCCEEDVYEAIRHICSLYNEILEEAYAEMEKIKKAADDSDEDTE